jgi:Spherulation-specific family 4
MVPLVPAYIWPTDDEAFKRALSGYVPGLAIVTGDNSGPGATKSSDLAARIDWLHDRNWQAIGYIRLDYMQRSLIDISADVNRWRTWYPKVAGFFFDECPTLKVGALEAAAALEALVTATDSVCVFNAGAPVDSEWFSVLSRSTIVTFEGTAETYAHIHAQRHARAAHLVYASSSPLSVPAGSSPTAGPASVPSVRRDSLLPMFSRAAPEVERVFDIRDTTPAHAGSSATRPGEATEHD